MLSFLASSCATYSKSSFFCQRPIPWLSSSQNVSVLFPVSTFHHSVRAVSVVHCSISLAPSTFWLAIPAATDPVFLPAFLLQLALGTSLLYLFLGKSIPTFLARVVFFFHHLPKPSTVRLLCRELSPLPICHWFSPFAVRESFVTFLTKVGGV